MNQKSRVTACLVVAASFGICLMAQNPTTTIANGKVKATLYLPDSKDGYYRGTRFDWSGVVRNVEYAGHDLYGPWYQRIDAKVPDYIYDGTDIVVGPCTSMMGVPEEFTTNNSALGWDEAKVGGTFIKIGVGVLRKPDDRPYDMFRLYDIVDGGKWTVRKTANSVEFTQELADPVTGYAYVYRKRVSLTPGKPQMLLEHTLRNTGKLPIRSVVYDHNFMRMDHQAPGPEIAIKMPFQPQPVVPLDTSLVGFRGNQIDFSKQLSGKDHVMVPFQGFGADSSDNDFRVENQKLGIGLRITGDRPIARASVWGIRAVFAVEPFIDMTIEPGSEFTWKITYDYYTIPKNAPQQ